ncbi:TrkH family potassium uptake protein [Paenibacillus sp. NPDC056579]|uniref:TrkH family potassium uptake protein n=1 Tax=unclassified Paenibacillus TaxID=185978 RepID=UPI001EF7A00E|nr:potassium transporter TrkG [Paenibacillus sp. H1-7]ULL14061.1 TrkH family potassium uptake protein [Paenibacillus sp. H1-7]
MLQKKIKQPSAVQTIVIAYFIIIFVVTVLLLLPISLEKGVKLSFTDALFISASAVSVTGLTTISTAETFSGFGTVVLMIAFQLGGIGVMTMGSFYWILFGKPIGLSQRKMMMIDQNRYQLSGMVQLMKLIIGMTLLFEGVGALLFGLYFYFTGYFDSLYTAMYHGLFHSVSSYTNAGFDLFGNSLIDFSGDVFVQGLTMILIVLGAIGFPVIAEIREYLFGGHKRFRFTLYTKITTTTFAILLFAGAAGIWITEGSHYFAGMPWYEQGMNSLFMSVTSRSAGLSTLNPADMTDASQLLISLLMFIGASPSSMGGGVRTTTVAIIVLMIITFMRGRMEIQAFGRSVRNEDMMKSFIFFITGLILVTGGIFVVLLAESHRFSLTAVIFEICSAFGTCGLSTGITADLSIVSKITLIVLMYIGRIGMTLFLTAFSSGKAKADLHYPEEKLIIG